MRTKPSSGDLLRALGYSGPSAAVRVTRSDAGMAQLVVLYDLPASHEELLEAAGTAPRRVVALIQPRQLSSLRALADGGVVTPVTLPDAGRRARYRDEETRRSLRDLLESGTFGRELLTVEPLLEEFDGVEIAAAALQLLERERSKAAEAQTRPVQTSPANAVGVFLGIGARDGVRPADIVGAIANICGVTGAEIGRVDIRESHTIVEAAPAGGRRHHREAHRHRDSWPTRDRATRSARLAAARGLEGSTGHRKAARVAEVPAGGPRRSRVGPMPLKGPSLETIDRDGEDRA